eukprot:4892452-Prymnesium_polylepis.1
MPSAARRSVAFPLHHISQTRGQRPLTRSTRGRPPTRTPDSTEWTEACETACEGKEVKCGRRKSEEGPNRGS